MASDFSIAMSDDVTAVYILGQPTPEQRKHFANAKHLLHIEEKLKFVDAKPGCGRVLSFGDRPDFACDYGIVKSEIADNITKALAWYLGVADAPQARTMADWLSIAMNTKVREVTQWQ